MVNYAQSYTLHIQLYIYIYCMQQYSLQVVALTAIRPSPWGTRAGIQMQQQRQHRWHRERQLRSGLWSRSVRLCDPAPRLGAFRIQAPRHRSESEPSTRATPCATPDGQRIHDAPGSIWDRALRREERMTSLLKMLNSRLEWRNQLCIN